MAVKCPPCVISKVHWIWMLQVMCLLTWESSAARVKSQVKLFDASVFADRRTSGKPKPGKKGKNKDKGDDKKKEKKRGQIRFPAISLKDLALYDMDMVDSRRMAEEYLKKEVPLTSGEAAKCCCKIAEGEESAKCKVLRGAELSTSRNPLRKLESVCPKSDGYHGWDNKKHFQFDEYPADCSEIMSRDSVDFNELLSEMVPDNKRAHEAMLIAEATLEDAVGPDRIAANAERCCCKTNGDPDIIDCAIMTEFDLERNGHCPEMQGYRLWSSRSQSFKLPEPPPACKVDGVEKSMKTVPRDFAIVALVAASALESTRYAIDPVASAMMHAHVEVVRQRLEDVIGLLEEAIAKVRDWWEVVRSRGAWIRAELLYAVVGGALQRALRFLTPVSVNPEAYIESNESDDSSNSPEISLETDSDLMREFVSFENEIDDTFAQKICQMLATSLNLNASVSAAAFFEPGIDELGSVTCESELQGIQQTLRMWGAWWKSEEPSQKEQIQDDEEMPSNEKLDWMKTWPEIKSSLDFAPWPLEPRAHEMDVPAICEADYMIGDETARYPKLLGGEPIMHTYMVFAGGQNSPTRPGCLDIVIKMAQLFPDLPRRGERGGVLSEYQELLEKSNKLGCQGLMPLGRVWHQVTTTLEAELREHGELTFSFTYAKTKTSGNFVIRTHSNNEKKKHHKRKKHLTLQTTLIKWISHTIIKYAAKTGDDDAWIEGVERSLRKTPPSISAHELAADYWPQLKEQEIPSPYDDEHCPYDEETEEPAPGCGDWPRDSAKFWASAELVGASLEVVISAARKVHDALEAGDWRLLAQAPIAYGGSGFDAPGVVDNSDWHCNKTVETCSVHPRCARAAAQMISRPFMQKKYASGWTAKLKTYLYSSGAFDSDGFHSYCHATTDAYCWSYTGCLKEMMNYLCSQDETAEHCCPNAGVAAACKTDVNSEGCSVCEKTTNPLEPVIPTYKVPGASKETLAWLRPGMAEAHAASCALCEEIRSQGKDKPMWGMVQILGGCKNKGEECRELCGLEEDAGDFANCEGWQSRCYDAGC